MDVKRRESREIEGGVRETFVERERAAMEEEREWGGENKEEPGGSDHRDYSGEGECGISSFWGFCGVD